ncbi:uncharacterized protein VICG_00739, partial [Vittaforma corneae ATCC 50505]
MYDSNEAEITIRHRGRPKKAPTYFKFSPYVYNTPLGFQYTQPTILNANFSGLPCTNPLKYGASESRNIAVLSPDRSPTAATAMRRERRSAAVRAMMPRKKKRHSSDESISSEIMSVESFVEEDPYEKLLDYDEENDTYLVKIRSKSYLHCEWIPRDEIKSTRVGAMKVKRFKKIDVDQDYTKIERIIHETQDEQGNKLVLVKWMKLPYEAATFELTADAEKCENFEVEIKAYRDRKRMRHMKLPLDWRPSKENQLKFDKSKVYKNGNTLRSYQIEGVNWLLNRWYFKQSCIMADEMGLGKTVQSVIFVNSLFCEFDYCAPALVVAPLSTIVHWEREFKNWTDLRVLTYHGSIMGRDIINEYEFAIKTGNISVRLFDVIITTYEMAMAGADHLMQFEYGVAVFDEAHRLKNTSSKAASCLRSFSIFHKVLLSGTPIQNNLNELWSLFNFIDPIRFDNLNNFLQEFKMEKSEDVQKLQNVLKPLMLRRMKEDVETTIPMKEETIIEVELTTIQKRYYRAILEKNIEFLTKGDRSNAPNLINAMMELRKCCIHPYLIKGAEEKIIGDYLKRKRLSGVDDVSQATSQNPAKNFQPIQIGEYAMTDSDEYHRIMIQSSGKLVLLDKLLAKLKDGHKVLIFSQMTKCLDLLADYLTYREYKFERIDGGVRGDLRQAAIDRFSTGDAFVFLLCTRAGGVGINLTAADTVVIFDSDWNPQNDLQAQARCHRIGQKNEVKIYRLITRNSYEREMFDKAGLKLGLDKAILQKMNYLEGQEEKTKGDVHSNLKKEDAIQLLLRKGAYGVLMDTDDASQKFCEEDIDQILERRTKVVKHSEGGNVFSKATFQVDEEIDDPDFWDNLLNQKKSEESEGRIKRQCRRLSREGNISDEDKEQFKILYSMYVSKKDNVVVNKMSKEELEIFQVFVTVLHKGVFDVGIDIFSDSFNHTADNLRYLIKYCIDLLPSQRLRNDFAVGLDKFYLDYDPHLFTAQSDTYLKYYEKFLFKIQIPLILKSLTTTEELLVEKTRGWSCEDDKALVNLVLTKGYDNFDYKDKSRDDINQRVRKIISYLSHKKEIRENDNMYFKTIMNFGRLTDDNELAVEKFLKKDTSKLKELINKICMMSRRSRRDTVDAECFERIEFFDMLAELDEIPIIRKVGMPRKWDIKKDSELRLHLLR